MSVLIPKEQEIFSRKIMDSEIEFICIINKRGRLLEYFGDDCINMPQNIREMFFMKIALRNSMQKDFDEYLGTVNYCMTQRGNKKFITIPLSDGNTILAIIGKNSNQDRVILTIDKMLQKDLQKNEKIGVGSI